MINTTKKCLKFRRDGNAEPRSCKKLTVTDVPPGQGINTPLKAFVEMGERFKLL